MDDPLVRITAALDAAGVPYMLTGSFASSIHGETRTTHDIDLVIDPTAGQLRRFVAALPPAEYYVSLPAAFDALERRSQFNVIELEANWKVDLIVRRERPFSEVEFDRRSDVEYAGKRIQIATAEDVILAKLEWAKSGGSLRQIEDAAGILKARDNLDSAYLDHWVRELQIDREWQAALAAAGRSTAAD
ncbi:MAG: hypothetical protein WBC44_10325 [Planctomycetaceae bacterium]